MLIAELSDQNHRLTFNYSKIGLLLITIKLKELITFLIIVVIIDFGATP